MTTVPNLVSTQSQRQQFLLFFGYKGDRFYGVQAQVGHATVQSALTERLTLALGDAPKALQFAARTDRGVHGVHNVATCWTKNPINVATLRQTIAAPRDDGLLYVKCYDVDRKVHARGNATSKFYRYVVESECSDISPTTGVWKIVPPIRKKHIEEAIACLLGEHDFTSFRGGGCSAGTPIKHIEYFRIKGPFIFGNTGSKIYYIDIVANGFLRKMIRNLVGTLVEIGTGLRNPEDMPQILEAKSRARAGLTAPPQGLTLMRVGFRR
jgi:tRNA pseudouridine38-40 synthase